MQDKNNYSEPPTNNSEPGFSPDQDVDNTPSNESLVTNVSVERATESNPVTPPTGSLPQNPINRDIFAPEKKSKKPLVIFLSFIGVLVLAGAVSAAYFFVIRTPDADYVKAANAVKTLQDKAKNFDEIGVKNGVFTDEQLKKGEDASKGYNEALQNLQQSPVVTRDGVAKTEYESLKKSFENYGSEMGRVMLASKMYNDHFRVCSEGSGASGFSEKCIDLLKSDDPYPDPSLSTWYQEYKEALLEMSDLFKEIQVAQSAQDQGVLSKLAERTVALSGKLQDLTLELNFDISKQNPSDKLQKLHDVLNQRKGVLLR